MSTCMEHGIAIKRCSQAVRRDGEHQEEKRRKKNEGKRGKKERKRKKRENEKKGREKEGENGSGVPTVGTHQSKK